MIKVAAAHNEFDELYKVLRVFIDVVVVAIDIHYC